jgi:CheY-like chemotaxis protein
MPDRKKQRVLQVTHADGRLLTALLTPDGHEVTEADGTSHALALTALEQFDLIVVENGSPVEATLRAGEILESRGHPAPGRTLRGRLLKKDGEGDHLGGARHA